MNDDFLHQLRRPPPLGFAARLRIKLNLPAETNGAPKFRGVSTWVSSPARRCCIRRRLSGRSGNCDSHVERTCRG